MKFHTNTNEEKLFKKVAIVCLALFIVILIVYFITFSNDCLRFLGPLFLCIPICFYISNLLKKDFVEFSEDKIIFLNHKGVNFEINIEEVKMIMIPTEKALKRKFDDNKIVIKRISVDNVISYSAELEKYIKDNLNVKISYYDKYSEILK